MNTPDYIDVNHEIDREQRRRERRESYANPDEVADWWRRMRAAMVAEGVRFKRVEAKEIK